jgi:hypothetical protein
VVSHRSLSLRITLKFPYFMREFQGQWTSILARPDKARFRATHAGAQIDLPMFRNGVRFGVEIMGVDAPRLTASMRIASADLGREALYVVYPGARRYRIDDRVEAVPLSAHSGPATVRGFPSS